MLILLIKDFTRLSLPLLGGSGTRREPSERETLAIKAESLDRLTEMIDFRRAVDRRDVLGCARILSSDRRVRRRVGAALARRVLGPLVPPKRERVVAHAKR